METWVCHIDLFKDKQLIKNNYTGEEYWVNEKDIPDTLSYLYREKGLKKVWFDGSFDASDIIFKFHNVYPDEDVIFLEG